MPVLSLWLPKHASVCSKVTSDLQTSKICSRTTEAPGHGFVAHHRDLLPDTWSLHVTPTSSAVIWFEFMSKGKHRKCLGCLGAGLPLVICGLGGVVSQRDTKLSSLYGISFAANNVTLGSHKSYILLRGLMPCGVGPPTPAICPSCIVSHASNSDLLFTALFPLKSAYCDI